MTENKQKENAEKIEDTALEKVDGGLTDTFDGSIPIPDIPIPVEVREEEVRVPKSDVDFRKELEEHGFDVERIERKYRRSNLGLGEDNGTKNSDKLA